MSTTGSIGYIDQNGNYRATFVGSDAYPEDVHEAIGDLLTEMNAEEFIQWVETGIAGGGYDGLYNHETMEERGESDGPVLIDADNYDGCYLNYTYVVGDGQISFFDPKNVMEYDAEAEAEDNDGDDLES
jgi:hypothetical protein